MKIKRQIDVDLSLEPNWASAWAKLEALRRAKGAGAVSLSEYDFSSVPKDEEEDCVLYEYARDSTRILKVVDHARMQFRKQVLAGDSAVRNRKFSVTLPNFTSRFESGYDGYIAIALAGRPQFPRTAWQDLAADIRQNLKGFRRQAVQMQNEELVRKHPVFIPELVQDNAVVSTLTLASWERNSMPELYRNLPEGRRRRLLLSGFMMVNLLHSPEEIVARFKKWLLEKHPRANKPAPETRGRRHSTRDRLNALGAMRLRFYCRTLADAQRITTPLRDKGGLYYGDRTAWNRACDRAVEYFQEVLDLPDKDLPIHFSEGWQK